MPKNISMPGAWNDSWDSPESVVHELDASIPKQPNFRFFPAWNSFFGEALSIAEEELPPYISRTQATDETKVYNHLDSRRDSGYEDAESLSTASGLHSAYFADSRDDIYTIDDISTPIVIAVFGQTGTGKTSLIKTVTGKDLQVGHNLTSCTEDVLAVPCRIDGKNVVLVDSPGFSDTNLSDTEILRRIAAWMKDNYDEGLLLSGIIYLHRITDVRMEGPSLKNLRMMKKLCGEGSLANVVMATTMWERVTEEVGARRERELKQVFWKDMIDCGSTVKRILTERGNDALMVVKSIMTNRPTSTRLQEELHNGKSLVQTEAGIEIREELAKLERKLKQEHHREMIDLREAQKQRNQDLERQIRAEMEETAQRLTRLEAESKILETSTPKRLPKCKRERLLGTPRYRCLYCQKRETYQIGRWTCPGCKDTQLNVW